MSNVPGVVPTPTIGIITALPKETAAVRAALGNAQQMTLTGAGAGRVYWSAQLDSAAGGVHNVVVAECGMGTNVAAVRATQLLTHFPHVTSIIMCGIAGGIPKPDKADDHVRLGDIVVSDVKGVVQYDFIKETAEFVESRPSPHRPSAELVEACRVLESDRLLGLRPWEKWITQTLKGLGWARPDDSSDVLTTSDKPPQELPHPADPSRKTGKPRIFFSPIASANTLLKNPVTRDRLRNQFGVKAVEMEGSGVQDATWTFGVGYLVVRGVCDYCDSNKNDLWQPYAAVAAAGYVRALLDSLPGVPRAAKPGEDPTECVCDLPPSLRDFTGRVTETGQITTRLRGLAGRSGRSLAICGMGGVGKSATAVEACWQAKDDFPDGQLFVDLRGMSDKPLTTTETLAWIIRAVRADTGQLPEEQAALLPIYRKVLAGKKLLVLLDNAKDEGQVRPVVSVGPSVAFVITSRTVLALDGVESIRLDMLPQGDALALLRNITTRGTDSELGAVAELCGRLPLALRVAGDFIRLHENWSVAVYIAALQAEATRLERLKGNSPERDVEAVLGLSACELVRENPQAAVRWQTLTIFPTLFDAEAAAVACDMLNEDGLDCEAAADTLTFLLDRSLVHYNARLDRYSLHDLMRPVARDVFGYGAWHPLGASSRDRLDAASARYAEYFTRIIRFSTDGSISLPAKGSSTVRTVGLNEEPGVQGLLKQTLLMTNFQVVLEHIAGLADRDCRKGALTADFETGMLDYLGRAIEFAEEQAPVGGGASESWRALTTQPWMGDLFWFVARWKAAQSDWRGACKFGDRARASFEVHNPVVLPEVDPFLALWRRNLSAA